MLIKEGEEFPYLTTKKNNTHTLTVPDSLPQIHVLYDFYFAVLQSLKTTKRSFYKFPKSQLRKIPNLSVDADYNFWCITLRFLFYGFFYNKRFFKYG